MDQTSFQLPFNLEIFHAIVHALLTYQLHIMCETLINFKFRFSVTKYRTWYSQL